jgi:E3 ubiquitin-protein ligase mind-bomb
MADRKKVDGYTALHIASLNGSIDVIKVLLGGGCKVDIKDCSGQTPLHLAAGQGYFRILELLLHNSNGADANARDADGNTPLHIALSREGEPPQNGSRSTSPESLLINEAILAKVKRAGVKEELSRWVSMGVLLAINGADPCVKNRQGLSCFDRIQDPASRAILLDESMANDGASAALPQTSSPAATAASIGIECQVCCEVTTSPVLFIPCSHRVTCSDCAARMKKCIECKAVISEKVATTDTNNPGSPLSSDSGRDDASPIVKDLEAKVQDWEDQFLCLICLERKKNIAFLCGHATCSECVETIRSCHMCRGPIQTKIQLY